MKTQFTSCLCLAITIAAFHASSTRAQNTADPLPSWNNGRAKQAIVEFVKATTTKGSPKFVAPAERIATFDEDGTTWVEHPMYTEVVFSLDRLAELAPQHPEWKEVAPFKAVLAGDKAAMSKFTLDDMMKIVVVTHTGVSPLEFDKAVKGWIEKAKDPRWHRPYTELVYQPMLEAMQ